MNTIIRLIIVSILMIVAAPAYSAKVVQVFSCEQDDDATEEALEAQALKWLKAARQMKGGAQLEVYLNYPWAAQMDENDFLFVLIAPSLEEWGVFFDNYKGSAAAQVDQGSNDLAACPDSSLWESVEIKVE